MKVSAAVFFLALSSSAFAQEAPAAAPNPLTSMAPFLIIFAIFYFLMIRPQKKRLQEEQSMLGALSKGEEVITKSGLFGTIAGLTDKVVTLEVAEGVKLKVLRSYIAGTSKRVLEEASAKKDDKKDNTKDKNQK